MTQSISRGSKRVDLRNQHHHDSNHELFGEEFDEVDSVKNRRTGNRGRRAGNINAIEMQITPFKGRNDAEAYLEWEGKVEMDFACHNYSKENKVKLTAVEFSGYALI